jgi:acetyl-CoA carboxylase biotin carboxylase subunit
VIRKVLIANRGEIVIRILRTLKDMGIEGVAVYSEPDLRAPHVAEAHEAYPIGPAEPALSYLNQDRLLEVAARAGCDAVHPGYGFLSENAAFARRCEQQGLTWIGPPPAAIDAMGTKVEARRLMKEAGVPVVPGTEGTRDDFEGLARAAEEMGYPVLIKASAGGGGKGMRIVHDPEDFLLSAAAACSEAEKAFGNPTIYLEKYLERPRHIEFQVFADSHGNVIHLFERECSIQRRHQKIIEESPSPALTPELRERMGEAAVAATRTVDYRGAGTIEFLLDKDGHFYFLEMNTRLQVEHPITEEVTKLDLVRLQVEVASGRPLPPEAIHAVQQGHAIECRVYAEDPSLNFLPTSGEVLHIRHPRGPGLRVDSALKAGFEVSIHYDPMMAKIITTGRDREEAVRRMRAVLSEFVVLGISTNLLHLQAILDTDAFLEGDLSTHFLQEHLPDWQPEKVPLPDEGRTGLVLHDLVGTTRGRRPGRSENVVTPWKTLSGWRPLAWRESV